MITLEGKVVDINFKKDFIRIGDIVNIDGPLFVLYKNDTNQKLYLFDWVDNSKSLNRWLVYEQTPQNISNFLKKEISRRDLFTVTVGKYYVLDIDINLEHSPVQKISSEALLSIYYPEKNLFFEEEDCPDYFKLVQFLKNEVSPKAKRVKMLLSQNVQIVGSLFTTLDYKKVLTLFKEDIIDSHRLQIEEFRYNKPKQKKDIKLLNERKNYHVSTSN